MSEVVDVHERKKDWAVWWCRERVDILCLDIFFCGVCCEECSSKKGEEKKERERGKKRKRGRK